MRPIRRRCALIPIAITISGLWCAGCTHPAGPAGSSGTIHAAEAKQSQQRQIDAIKNNNTMPPEVKQRVLAAFEANKRGQY